MSLIEKEPSLEKIIHELELSLIDDPLFACAAISIKDGNVVLTINQRKFDLLTQDEMVAVMAHEIGHLILGHLSHRTIHANDRFIISLAQDLALNSGLEQSYTLPKWFVTAEKLKLPPMLSTEQYIELLSLDNQYELKKIVKIPDIIMNSDHVSNKKILKSLIDKVPMSIIL
jgi:predicted metal-dependent peptidase